MRSLLLPIGLLGLGILLALPFRRHQILSLSSTTQSDVPRSVTPLRESSGTGDGSGVDVSDLKYLTQPTRARQESPFDLTDAPIPSSYEEVAIPLVLSNQLESNLLSNHPRTSATSSQRTRYGIPLDAYAAKNPEVPASGWSPPKQLRPAVAPAPGSIASRDAGESREATETPLKTASMALPIQEDNTRHESRKPVHTIKERAPESRLQPRQELGVTRSDAQSHQRRDGKSRAADELSPAAGEPGPYSKPLEEPGVAELPSAKIRSLRRTQDIQPSSNGGATRIGEPPHHAARKRHYIREPGT